MERVLLGLLLSAAIGYAGHSRQALSWSGAAGATVIGTAVFGFGGWDWGMLLVAFFVSSSLLSHYRGHEKATLAEKFAKGSQRDLGQTIANGGLGATLAVCSAVFPHWLWLVAYVGAMATVNADTWATEVGVLSAAKPRLITSGREVEVGTSGAVSWLGTIAALVGGIFIGMLAGIPQLMGQGDWGVQGAFLLVLAGLVGGLVGSFFDSLLGATVQSICYCDRCNKETERAIHGCGMKTRRLRGWRWLDNDLVNLTSSAVGAVAASGLILSLR